MLYIERNDKGEIIALHREAEKPGMESKETIDNEILAFLGREDPTGSLLQLLSSTDTGIVRIFEDLIDLLIKKNIIMFTELPEHAQQKILKRRQLRRQIADDSFILDDV